MKKFLKSRTLKKHKTLKKYKTLKKHSFGNKCNNLINDDYAIKNLSIFTQNMVLQKHPNLLIDMMEYDYSIDDIVEHQMNSNLESILIIGDGNFSWTKMLSSMRKDARIISTEYESLVSYYLDIESASNIVSCLNNKVFIMFGIDALKLSSIFNTKFNEIHFNCPWLKKNNPFEDNKLSNMIFLFFYQSSLLLNKDGNIFMFLAVNVKNNDLESSFNNWLGNAYGVFIAAHNIGYRISSWKFYRNLPYQHKSTQGNNLTTQQTFVHCCFSRTEDDYDLIDNIDPFAFSRQV